MTFPEKTKDKVYCDDIPNYIKNAFPNFYFNKIEKAMHINKDNECEIIISNIKNMYYDEDDIFYIKSKLYIIIMWNDVKKWKIINRV